MILWETNVCKAAVKKMKKTGLFSERELDVANSWLEELGGEAFASPNKVAEMTGYSGNYVQWLCKEEKINAFRDFFGWWKIPVDEIIELKKRKLAKGQ